MHRFAQPERPGLGLEPWKEGLVEGYLSGLYKDQGFTPQKHSVASHCLLNTGLGLGREQNAPVIQPRWSMTALRGSWEKTIRSSPFRQGRLHGPQTSGSFADSQQS